MWRTALLLFALAALGAEKKPVTIEALYSGPRERPAPSLEWAPDGRRFAYEQDKAIWVYDVPSADKKQVLALDKLKPVAAPEAEAFDWQNRRVAEKSFQWSRSGHEMLVSSGGDLFLLHLDTGRADQLTATPVEERDPKLSSDGRWVSFRRLHDLYTLEISTRKTTRLTSDGSDTLLNGELDWVYPEELELGTAHWWSADSRWIAFLQLDVSREPVFPHAYLLTTQARYEPQRFPQPGTPNADARLGIVAAAGGPVRWVDLGDTRDYLLARVYWSPEGTRPTVAVERLNRIQNRIQLWLVDGATAEARVALHEQDAAWINVNDAFRFLKDGKQFLWGSERDGFLHLYLYGETGKESRRITSGEWEVSDVACVDEASRRIYYTSTEASPLERQLYRVDFNGKHKQRLSAEPGTHSISMGPTCEYYMDSYSSLASPTRRVLRKSDGSQLRVYEETPAQELEILPSKIMKVKASDGELLYARLVKPNVFQAGRKYPAVVMVYGGPHAQMVRDAWIRPGVEQVLAHRGFVIWQLDNRGSAGRGHRWEAQVFRNFGAKELADQQEGIRYLTSLGFVDAARVGIYGWSYGGYMTLYSLVNAPGLFRAGVAGAPVTDWKLYDTIYTERYMDVPQRNPDGYRRSSPIGNTSRLEAKLLMIHNLEDDNVHFQNTVQMADALERAGKQFRMVVYPQRSHGVTGPVARHLTETVVGFFEEELMGKPASGTGSPRGTSPEP